MKKRWLALGLIAPTIAATSCALVSCDENRSYYYVDFNTKGHGHLSSTNTIVIMISAKFSDFSWRMPTPIPDTGYEFVGWYQDNRKMEPDSSPVGHPGGTVVLTAHFESCDHYFASLTNRGATIVSGQEPKKEADANIVVETNQIYTKFDMTSLAIKINGVQSDISKFNIDEKLKDDGFDQLTIKIGKDYVVGNIEIDIKVKFKDFKLIKDFTYTEEPGYPCLYTNGTVNFEKNKMYITKIDLSIYRPFPTNMSLIGGSLFSYDNSIWKWLNFYNDVTFIIDLKPLNSDQYKIQPNGPTGPEANNGNYQIVDHELIKNDSVIYFAFVAKEALNNGRVSFFIDEPKL